MSLLFDYVSRKARYSSDPGRLDRRVRLQVPVTSRDAVGGVVTTWSDLATVWAAKLPQSGARDFSANEKNAIDLVQFRIRHRPDLAPYMRLVHGDDVYEIIPPVTELGRRHFLELTCRAVNQTVSDNAAPIELIGGGLLTMISGPQLTLIP